MPFIFRFPSNSLGNIKVVNMDFTPSFLNTLCINSTKGGEGEKRKILNSETKMTFQSQIAPLTHNRDRKCTKCATAVFLNLWPGRDLKFASKNCCPIKSSGPRMIFLTIRLLSR